MLHFFISSGLTTGITLQYWTQTRTPFGLHWSSLKKNHWTINIHEEDIFYLCNIFHLKIIYCTGCMSSRRELRNRNVKTSYLSILCYRNDSHNIPDSFWLLAFCLNQRNFRIQLLLKDGNALSPKSFMFLTILLFK